MTEREKLIEAIARGLAERQLPGSTLTSSRRYVEDDRWRGELRRDARAALAAIETHGAVIVPKVPTEEMVTSLRHSLMDAEDNARRLWIPEGKMNLLPLSLAVAIAASPYKAS